MLDLLRAAPLIDGHNDLLWELRQCRDPADPTLMTDLPRMAAGGVGGQFWSVYVPSDLPADAAVTMTLEQIDALLDVVRRNPDRLELARSADEVRARIDAFRDLGADELIFSPSVPDIDQVDLLADAAGLAG